ncbi:hypothetical protein [Colwellia demingiae]|nr:hypothetical protein [Colwellia demingiae]
MKTSEMKHWIKPLSEKLAKRMQIQYIAQKVETNNVNQKSTKKDTKNV